MEFVLSIGLNVSHDEPQHQLSSTLRAIVRLGRIVNLAMIRGEWDGVAERTLQVRIRSALGVDLVRDLAAEMADSLHQECIALAVDGAQCWELVAPDCTLSAGASLETYPVEC